MATVGFLRLNGEVLRLNGSPIGIHIAGMTLEESRPRGDDAFRSSGQARKFFYAKQWEEYREALIDAREELQKPDRKRSKVRKAIQAIDVTPPPQVVQVADRLLDTLKGIAQGQQSVDDALAAIAVALAEVNRVLKRRREEELLLMALAS